MNLGQAMTTANLDAEVKLIEQSVANAKAALHQAPLDKTCPGHASLVSFSESNMDLTAFVAIQQVDAKRMLHMIIDRIGEVPAEKRPRQQEEKKTSEARFGKFVFKNIPWVGIVAIILALVLGLILTGSEFLLGPLSKQVKAPAAVVDTSR